MGRRGEGLSPTVPQSQTGILKFNILNYGSVSPASIIIFTLYIF